jgi:hypothetical protein
MNCRNARETLVRTDPCGVRLNYRTVLSRIPRSVAPQKVIAELGVLRPAESVRSPPIRGDGPPSLGHYGNLGSGAAFHRRSTIPKLAAVSRRRALETASKAAEGRFGVGRDITKYAHGSITF